MMRAFLMGTTALFAMALPAEAAPVALAFVGSLAGAAASAWVTGTAVAWGVALGNASIAGALAGAQMLLQKRPERPDSSAQALTLNRVQPITTGLILYGRRTLGRTVTARSTTDLDGITNRRLHRILPLCCHAVDGFEAVYLGDELVWTAAQHAIDIADGVDAYLAGQIDGPYKGRFRMRLYDGADDQLAEPRYVAAAPEWTETSRGRGIAYVYFEADFDRDIWPRGPEQIRVTLRGKRVLDPRTGQTAYSENPALHVRDYVLTPESRGGIGWSAADVNDADIIAMANVFDEPVQRADGQVETRCAFNGVLDTALAPEANLDRLSTAWGGWWTFDRGQLRIGGAAYTAPVLEITEDMLSAPIRGRSQRAYEDQFNAVKAIFADPETQHTPTDLPVLRSATYRAADGGEELFRDLGELYGETSPARGQRLMRLALLKARRQRIYEVPCRLDASEVKLGDTVMLTIPRRGWTQKPFEVTRRRLTVGPEGVEVRFSVIETASAIFDWQTSLEQPRPANVGVSYASATQRPQVSAPSVAEELYSTRWGAQRVRVDLASSTAHPAVDLWQFAVRAPGESAFRERPAVPVGADRIDDLELGVYAFGARARNRRGAWGPWSYTSPLPIEGEAPPPSDLTGFSVQPIGPVALARWDLHPSPEVTQGGRVEIRHHADPTGPISEAVTIGRAVPGAATEATLPLKPGRYFARAIGAAGALSGPVSQVVTRAGLEGFTLAATPAVALVTGNARENVSIVSGAAVLDAGQAEGTITEATVYDHGSVADLRLVSGIAAVIADPDTLFGQTGGTFGIAGEPFGTTGQGSGDVQLLVRWTQDDPAASPDWTGWQRVDVADITARAVQLRGRLLSGDGAAAVRATALNCKIYT